MPSRIPTDRDWSERIARGDADALEDAYDAFSGVVYRQAMAILGSVADAEDAVQEVFIKLARRKDRPIDDLKAYLLTAIRHESYTLLKKRGRETTGWDHEDADPQESSFEWEGERESLRQALSDLPPEQREVVVLKVVEEMTFEEIGRAVKASVNTVASRYRYALKKLRRSLGESTHA